MVSCVASTCDGAEITGYAGDVWVRRCCTKPVKFDTDDIAAVGMIDVLRDVCSG